MAKAKITFKNQPRETGLRAVGYPYPFIDLKLQKKTVGFIVPPSAFSTEGIWKVFLHVAPSPKDLEISPTSRFVNRQLATTFSSAEEAKGFIRSHNDEIQDKVQLVLVED